MCFQSISTETIHLLTLLERSISDHAITNILLTYNFLLILTINGLFKPFNTQHIYPPHQPQRLTISHAAASFTIATINNLHPFKPWMDLLTIPLLSRVQPLPAAYRTNNDTNNTAELLARIMVYELLPLKTPVIIIYDFTVVHSQHLAMIGNTYTNRQRSRTAFPAISKILAQRLEATTIVTSHSPTYRHHTSPHPIDETPTLIDTIITQIKNMPPWGKTWLPTEHITIIDTRVYIEI